MAQAPLTWLEYVFFFKLQSSAETCWNAFTTAYPCGYVHIAASRFGRECVYPLWETKRRSGLETGAIRSNRLWSLEYTRSTPPGQWHDGVLSLISICPSIHLNSTPPRPSGRHRTRRQRERFAVNLQDDYKKRRRPSRTTNRPPPRRPNSIRFDSSNLKFTFCA